MAVLRNQRHEAFAQHIAEGATADDAYAAAGFSANRGNAARLKANEHVRARVGELQAYIAERAIMKAATTKEWIIQQLVANSAAAQAAGKFEASNAALKLIGQQLFGMFVDRKEVKKVDEFQGMSDEELDTFIETRSRELLQKVDTRKAAREAKPRLESKAGKKDAFH